MRIGFSFNRAKGGPANFMNNLRESWDQQKLVKTSYYFNPLNDCNIYANLARLTWYKKFFFRIDGIIYDLLADPITKQQSNHEILKGAKQSRGVIFQSNFSKNLFEKILGYVPPTQIIIHNGTNLNKFKRIKDNGIREKLNIPSDAFVFITSAEWRTHKRLKYMIDSFIAFKDRHKTLKTYLLVIGEHEDLNIENVIFLKRVDNCLLPIYYSIADVYLFYSWLDNCPNSVIEAICCGLPVICTNQGGTCELIEMSDGGIVVDADAQFLYKEIELYNPPMPDMVEIAKAMDEMYNNYDYYANKINRDVFDINIVSRKYLDFIKTNL